MNSKHEAVRALQLTALSGPFIDHAGTTKQCPSVVGTSGGHAPHMRWIHRIRPRSRHVHARMEETP